MTGSTNTKINISAAPQSVVSFQLGIKGIIQNERGEILLLHAQRPGQSGKVKEHWDIPGGRVDWNEISTDDDGRMKWDDICRDTLTREIIEETGLTNVEIVSALPIVPSCLSGYTNKETGEKVFLLLAPFLCKAHDLSKIELSDEHSDYRWVSPQEAADLLSFKWPSAFTDIVRHMHTTSNNT